MSPRVAIVSLNKFTTEPQRKAKPGKVSLCLCASVVNDLLFRQLTAQQFLQGRSRAADSHVELPEQGIHRADVIEAHLIDQLLEDQRIVGEKIDTPLPIIEAD